MALVRLNRRSPRITFTPFSGATTSMPTLADMENRLGGFIDRMFSEPFGSSFAPESIAWLPAMDIVETPNEYILSAELPGVEQKNVDVSIDDGVLMIRGEKMEERKEEQDKKVYLYERSFGSFERAFALPPIVDVGKIAAEFDKGVLKVHMPKGAEVKPKGRKIDIK
jgi:HSP20 family protein